MLRSSVIFVLAPLLPSVLESYKRAYNHTVRVQQLSELEEVIEYCTLPPMGNHVVEGRRALFPNMWNERIRVQEEMSR
ncbi:hypothetical protein MTR67_017961 [Solanum verrucosum]|uniref:PIK-related kinase FAT domain-containing protein n=1 Tax=Solanum verrucosum TaxID=315347 RepID=A0AAF0TLZ9_SOLVR|nr:hypothetical protein MTR67_017961 [Solanum verrucosum]